MIDDPPPPPPPPSSPVAKRQQRAGATPHPVVDAHEHKTDFDDANEAVDEEDEDNARDQIGGGSRRAMRMAVDYDDGGDDSGSGSGNGDDCFSEGPPSPSPWHAVLHGDGGGDGRGASPVSSPRKPADPHMRASALQLFGL